MLQRRRVCSNWFSSWKKAKFSANRENCVITLFMPQNSWKLRTWKHVKPLELGKNWGKGSIILKPVGKLRSSRSVIRSSNICYWATSLLSSQQKFLDLMSEALWLEDAMHSWKHLPVSWMSIFIANSESKNFNFTSRIPATRFLCSQWKNTRFFPRESVQPKKKDLKIFSFKVAPTKNPPKPPNIRHNINKTHTWGGGIFIIRDSPGWSEKPLT